MGQAELIERSIKELSDKAKEFTRAVSSIENNYGGKLSEIRVLEGKIENLRKVIQEKESTATAILQKANEDATKMRREAAALMDIARKTVEDSKSTVTESNQTQAETRELLKELRDKQAALSRDSQIFERKKQALDAAWNK